MGKIICKSENGIDIEFDINERITVIGGLSASGKTYVINAIKNIKKNNYNVSSNINVSRFVIIDDELNIYNTVGIDDNSIVLVDRYDSFSLNAKKKIWEKMYNTKAIWIIMSRNPDFPDGFSCSTHSFKELHHYYDNKHHIFNLQDVPWT